MEDFKSLGYFTLSDGSISIDPENLDKIFREAESKQSLIHLVSRDTKDIRIEYSLLFASRYTN